MPLEEPVLGLQFFPACGLGSGAAGTAEPPHVQAAHVATYPASTGPHDPLKSEYRITEGQTVFSTLGQYAPFGKRKKTREEYKFELDKSVVSQKIQEGGRARVFFLVL
jgi:hypothetical protein